MCINYCSLRAEEVGFTLIEIVIVTAILGILAVIAVPSFISYRDKSRVTTVVATANAVRAALANYAADSDGNLYPSSNTITDYASLRALVDANGGTLPTTGLFIVNHYTRFDSNGDAMEDNYSMRFTVSGVPPHVKGYQILIAPGGIWRCGQPTPADCD
jgi:prepilin-type N-terminal cleavage/methylation domain-containing protein